MAVTFNFGKWIDRKTGSYNVPFGQLEAELSGKLADKNLKAIAGILANKFDIKKGTITLHSINFSYLKQLGGRKK